ncbi:MAG: tRNA(5-methylaminomethyl-2-thiouridylate)-methyl transferase [Frankiales bacterium]|nr:tRNA(5-methylaminomethyl-2-thiouridylate)-methyl transferase [Frankiales bacterium]
MKLLAAMSGGVDSAVAAALAVEDGHSVTGVHLALSQAPAALRSGSRGCCSREDARDASRAADVIGIPFYVWDLAAEFQASVIDDFVAEYAAGRTPNPCVRCNEKVKFSAVLDRALQLGFDGVVTGHHARLVDGVLSRSADIDKDQSYVLGVLTPAQLAATVLPLGSFTKPDVRSMARARGLGVADKPDSHDICFIADGDTAGFLRSALGPQPGPVVDALTGAVVGTHDGAYGYTVGQRRGLGLTVPAADGRPRYVLSVEPVSRTVTVGPATALDVSTVVTDVPVWSVPRSLPLQCSVQLRAHGMVHDCTVSAEGEGWSLALATSARGVAAGQTAVLYDGDTVLGSATIRSTA